MSEEIVNLKEIDFDFNCSIKYIALNSGSPGEIILYKSKDNSSKIQLHEKEILYMEFSQFNNEILASLTIDNIIYINDFSSYQDNQGEIILKCKLEHKGTVVLMNFNPSKPDILCSCEEEGKAYIWNTDSGNVLSEFEIEKNPIGMEWSPNGNLIGICFENGLLNIYTTEDMAYFYAILSEKISEKNLSGKSFAWINDNSFVSVGWCKDNSQKLCIWDEFINKENSIFGEGLIYSEKIDDSYPDMIPYVNPQNKLIYLINNQDIINHSHPSIIVYVFTEKQIFKMSEYFTSMPADISLLIHNKFYDRKNHVIDKVLRYNLEENNIYCVSISKEEEIKNSKNINTIDTQYKNPNSHIENNFQNNHVNTLEEREKKRGEIEALKEELEKQKIHIENLEKENMELKNKDNNKEHQQTNSNLEKIIEDIIKEKENMINEHKIKINNHENKWKRLEEEIEKLKKVIGERKYKNQETPESIENNNYNNKDLSMIKNTTNILSLIDFNTMINEDKGIGLKLEQIGKIEGDKNNDENNNIVNEKISDYRIYNVNIQNEEKDVVLTNGNEFKTFSVVKNNSPN